MQPRKSATLYIYISYAHPVSSVLFYDNRSIVIFHFIYVHTYVHMYIYIHTYIHLYTYIYVCIYICISIRAYTQNTDVRANATV